MVELRLGGDSDKPKQVYVCTTPACAGTPKPDYSAPTCGTCGRRMTAAIPTTGTNPAAGTGL